METYGPVPDRPPPCPAGTAAFNEELGRMTALSFPVIAVPATLVMIGAMLYLFRGIRQLTGLNLDDILHLPQSSKE